MYISLAPNPHKSDKFLLKLTATKIPSSQRNPSNTGINDKSDSNGMEANKVNTRQCNPEVSQARVVASLTRDYIDIRVN